MTEGRLARGRRFLGHCRLRRYLVAGLVLALLVAVAGSASASSRAKSRGPSGGAGVQTRTPPHKSRPSTSRRTVAGKAQSNPFAARGMWIWILSSSNGGSLPSIIARAHQYGIGTVIIKSGDGGGAWSQFSPGLVSALHAAGLHVCGWQYVYGNNPSAEARVGAATVRDGADCLVIDAESEYEGKYVSAQTYITQLRNQIGANFPVALAGFPYVDFHPGFPYSVFLGPGGAQYNMPQMYWKDIGVSVDTVYAHTYAYNRPYQRSIYPLGQVYNTPPPGQIIRFRQLSRAYDAANVSWWDWQESSLGSWYAVAHRTGPLTGFTASPLLATIQRGAAGDLVVWAQEHLYSAGDPVSIDGGYGATTQTAVVAFQLQHGLTQDGMIGPATWTALLRYRAARVQWTSKGATIARGARSSVTLPVPRSSRLRSKRNELAGAGGAGRP